MNNRWYDKYPHLPNIFEKLKNMDKKQLSIILDQIKYKLLESDPRVIDDNVMKFPMTLRRRWYDNDPESWLILNGLKYAKEDIKYEIIEIFKN